MWSLILFCVVVVVADEEEFRTIKLDSGLVRGEKYWNGDYYEFYAIPYATAPKGRDKFKAPLPVTPWDYTLTASNSNNRCLQCYYVEDATDEEAILDGTDDCLTMNVLVPTVVSEENPAPVLVYIHSGAYAGGSGNMAKFGYLARHDIVVVSFNYRVGAIGFACLGNEEIPGNAGLKDQVAALRWIKDNIKKFGGDPNKITLAGFSVGAAMAELLALSKATDGLFHQLILESGSALSPFAINRDPVNTAWNLAQSMGYDGSESLEELTEFYLNANNKTMALRSINFFLPNSTFGFAPCIEKDEEGAVITESPLDTLKSGNFKKIPVLTGFANMEGLSRSIKFGVWREEMNEDFSNFLPADLRFSSKEDQEEIVKKIKTYYFKDKIINHESLQNYIDYFSDSMFKYSIMKSANIHSSLSKNPLYLYEFSHVGKLNIQHNYMDKIKGASHRDQTAYLLDFHGFTNNYKDLATRDRLTTMWTDFVRYGNPTEFESAILTVKWPPYTKQSPNYLDINKQLQVKSGLLKEEYEFWDQIYNKYYWNPSTVEPVLKLPKSKDNKEVKDKESAIPQKKSIKSEKKKGEQVIKNSNENKQEVKIEGSEGRKEKPIDKTAENQSQIKEEKTDETLSVKKKVTKDSPSDKLPPNENVKHVVEESKPDEKTENKATSKGNHKSDENKPKPKKKKINKVKNTDDKIKVAKPDLSLEI